MTSKTEASVIIPTVGVLSMNILLYAGVMLHASQYESKPPLTHISDQLSHASSSCDISGVIQDQWRVPLEVRVHIRLPASVHIAKHTLVQKKFSGKTCGAFPSLTGYYAWHGSAEWHTVEPKQKHTTLPRLSPSLSGNIKSSFMLPRMLVWHNQYGYL